MGRIYLVSGHAKEGKTRDIKFDSCRHDSTPVSLLLRVLRQDVFNKKIIKKHLKKICIKCLALPVNLWVIWFTDEDMQLGIFLSHENSSCFLSSSLVMTWLNIIYDLDHKLFTSVLINYVSPKCKISDYV